MATTSRSSEGTAQATRTEGEALNTAILGGRFLQSVITEEWGGERVDAVVRLGFDRRRQVYTISRCDTWGTYCVEAEGVATEPGLLLLQGTALDPLGADTETYRFTIRLDLPDHYSVGIDFILSDGRNLTLAESTFVQTGENP